MLNSPAYIPLSQLYWFSSHGIEIDKMTDKQSDDAMVLVQQYRGVMAMIQQNYTRRTATNRFYISIGSALLIFLTYAVNPSVDTELQSVAATMVAVVGLVLCLDEYIWVLQ